MRARLEAMEQGMAVRNFGTLCGVPSYLSAVDLGSRSDLRGLINLVANCAGARSAGNPHSTCDVAGIANGFTFRIVKHSHRKPAQPQDHPQRPPGSKQIGLTFGTPRQSSTLPGSRSWALALRSLRKGKYLPSAVAFAS
jgi:hypothetical protein